MYALLAVLIGAFFFFDNAQQKCIWEYVALLFISVLAGALWPLTLLIYAVNFVRLTR